MIVIIVLAAIVVGAFLVCALARKQKKLLSIAITILVFTIWCGLLYFYIYSFAYPYCAETTGKDGLITDVTAISTVTEEVTTEATFVVKVSEITTANEVL